MPILTVLVGLPGSGKSTSIPENYDGFVYSTDRYIEECAKMNGLTYSQAFDEFIGPATKAMNEQLGIAVRQKANVIFDQTNMSSKKRKSILSRFPKTYRKICICRVPPRDETEWQELKRRILSRKGKDIPENIIKSMYSSYTDPTLKEGFDEVLLLDIYGNEVK